MTKKTHPHTAIRTMMRTTLLVALLAIVSFSCDTQMENDGTPVTSRQVTPGTIGFRPLLTYGYQGFVYNQAGTLTIPNTVITFSKTDENYVRVAVSDAYGSYKISLKAGSYYVTATATGYSSYSSLPGYFVVTGTDGYQTGNSFLGAETASGFQGFVYDDASSFTVKIPNAYITLTSVSNPGVVYAVYSDAYGGYKINLPAGSYYEKVQASGYQTYDSTPGVAVCTGSGYQTGNYFLTANGQ